MSTNVNDPWNRGNDPLGDIASAIGNFRDKINDDGPITIGVMRGSPITHSLLKMIRDIENVKVVIFDNPNTPDKCTSVIDWDVVNESLAIGERIHLIENEFIKTMNKVGTLAERQRPNFITVNDEFADLCLAVQSDARRYMVAPDNINVAGLPDQNNKPWYQDRKHFKNKKSRRKL